MSLHLTAFPELPEETARLAKKICKKPSDQIYLVIGDQLTNLFADIDFTPLYARDGKPALSPNLLAMVCVLQALDNLPDRQAADAVRLRIDWKYALHLPLDHTGFDASDLSEFRERLLAHEMGQTLFETVLQRLRTLGLLHKGGLQRTDATRLLAASRLLNRVEFVAETMRLALEALNDQQPAWLRSIALPHWYERYGLVLTGFRLPRSAAKQEALALDIGRDGYHLLQALGKPSVPAPAGQLAAVQTLATAWPQQFEEHPDGLRFRPPAAKVPATEEIVSPHDPEARFSRHNEQTWEGYQTHWTETCDADQPHLITHVAVTTATLRDVELLPQIHADLARLRLLPAEHLVDAGYTSTDNLLDSWLRYGVRVVGPLSLGSNWQSGLPDGITLEQFEIDEQHQTARCPQGQISTRWQPYVDADGQHGVRVAFPKAACQACVLRERCTKDSHTGRRLVLTEHYQFRRDAHRYQESTEFKQEYARRAGMEGTVSAAVRTHHARRSRYFGQAKSALQAFMTAIAINIKRSARWLLGDRPAQTRPPGLACLAPA
jgi:transposase